MNYKVILADDEEEVLQSIHQQLDWESYGFEVVGTFLNGFDVMEFLETREADIVITDIRMPFMDGMELAKNVRERYPQMKVIIISGYGDFQYAKEAMGYQVTDFILKPVNAKEMRKVLQRAREALDQELQEQKNIHLLEQQYQASSPILREYLLNRIIAGEAGGDRLNETLENCGIALGNASCWTVALIQLDRVEQEGTGCINEQYAFVRIRSLIQERLQERYICSVFYSPAGECVIFGMREPEQIERILGDLDSVARESRRMMDISPAIGVGRIKTSLLEAKDSFEEAKEALMYRKIAWEGEVIYMEDINSAEQNLVLFGEESRELLFSAIKFGESDDVREAIRQIRSQLEGQNMNRSGGQAYLISVLNAFLMFAQKYTVVMEEMFEGTPDCLKILHQYGEMESFFAWLEDRCLCINRFFEKERADKVRNLIQESREYIKKEYHDPEISLEKTAQKVGLTTTYFSSIFKKETGETFVEYLTKLRLEKALQMLNETEDKVYEIAAKAGYADPGYFSHVFKKKYGISPLQYRRQRS